MECILVVTNFNLFAPHKEPSVEFLLLILEEDALAN